jgi:cytochrome P450 family 135
MDERDRSASARLTVLDEAPAEPLLPPGPRSPGSVQSLSWFRDPVAFMTRNRQRHGAVFSVRLGALRRCAVIADPAAAWQVLTGDPELMRMGSTNGIFRPVLGDRSLFLLDGQEHRRHRTLLMPAFHRGTVRRFSSLVSELAARDVAAWPLGTPFELQERMRSVTLEMIFRVVIGFAGGERDERLRLRIHDLLDLVQNPIAVLPAFQYELGGRSPFGRLMTIVAEIDRLLRTEISERRHDPGRAERDDVLSMLVRPQAHEPGYLSDREVRDELMTLLIAGHETTATALAWTFERLLRHPAVMARLVDEIDVGADDAYLDAVVRESLRQRPVLPITARKLSAPVELAGFTFPAGWTLMPCIFLIHNDPEAFPDPDRFDPDRFLTGRMPSSRVWIPFGAGPRHCLGSSLSLMAIKVVLRTVLRRAVLRPERADPERIVRRNFTLGPERGATAVLERRLEPRRPAERELPVRGGPPGPSRPG